MNDFSKLLNDYFIKYLTLQRKASENTLKTYRDTFVKLIEYMSNEKAIKPNKIKMTDLTYENLCSFLNWLEEKKNVSTSTRNNRLAAIKSFIRYVSYKEPIYLEQCTSLLSIHKKTTLSKPMNYLTIEGIEFLLKSFNQDNTKGLRSLCIIALLYESGARVSELCNIRKADIKFEKPYTMVVTGKGRKMRIIPIDYSVILLLKKYVEKYQVQSEDYLFFNARREKLTREGINYILHNQFEIVKNANSALFPDTLSAHGLRHSRAMHLLENGVNLIYIRDILGHTSVKTTEIYSKVNPEIKRKFIERAATKLDINIDYNEKEKEELLEWLKNSF